jgi:hypothetical protein
MPSDNRASAPMRNWWSLPTGGRISIFPPSPVDGVFLWSSVLRKDVALITTLVKLRAWT